MSTTAPNAPNDFIRAQVREDLASGKHSRIVTRFPPEPNGYLHIGHAKAICLNFGLAEETQGACHLRFDDTNPTTEDEEYARNIMRDVQWLGFEWDALYYASDYFEQLYQYAVRLIEKGLAYVDTGTEEEIRAQRGTVTEPGTNSPFRDRSVAENLELFARMRAGDLEEGAAVLRAKIDMAHPNMKMRDLPLYRIRKAHHYRTGNDWSVYPMYDFAHCLSDSIEGISHSLCSLEFENNRAIYDWILDNLDVPKPQPRQYEFARLNITYTVMSKRTLRKLVEDGHVRDWDDPRMPTLAGLRRRGVTADAIRAFCTDVGVAKANSTVDLERFDHFIRDDLNQRAPRVMAVLDPLKVVITNYPEAQSEELDASYWPHDVPREGSRKVPFSRELYIEREDFAEKPSKGFKRLAPDREVRLRYAYFIRCDEVIKDEHGEIVELRCTYDPATRGGNAPDGRKVKGTVHWLSAERSLAAEVRLYEPLMSTDKPDLDPRFVDLNPDSLRTVQGARVEPSLGDAAAGDVFQFERTGYFAMDPDSNAERLVFNRTVGLRDSWGKKKPPPDLDGDDGPTAVKPSLVRTPKGTAGVAKPRELSAEAQARLAPLVEAGISESDARTLAERPDLVAFLGEARERHDNAAGIASWIVNELLRELKERAVSDLPFGPAELAGLVALVDGGTVSTRAAKDVFARLVDKGGDPAAIVEAEGLGQVSDASSLEPVIKKILADHPDEVGRYRAGESKLRGFFVGQIMKATKGAANPALVQELIKAFLDDAT